ncbi:hypothetical protein BsWGS_27725 [Bradybaena similaris]
MGDLKGHMLPGIVLLLAGLWWAVGCIRRFLQCRKAGVQYVSTATFPCPISCGNSQTWPVEAVIKIVVSLLGIIAEVGWNLPHPGMVLVQHATMYFFFMISGVVDLSLHLGLPLPPGTDYAALALAFLMMGFLFTNHLHDRELLDVKIHVMLSYVIFLTVLVILLEARHQKSAMLTLSRSFLVILQGSWLCAVGLILYSHGDHNEAWDLKSHSDVMLAAVYFCWHCAAIFILLVILTAVMSLCYRKQDGGVFRNGSGPHMAQVESNGKYGNYKLLTVRDSEDSDIEFQQPVKKTPTVV